MRAKCGSRSPPTAPKTSGRPVVESHRVDPSATVEERFRSVAARTARRIQETWKSENLLFFDREGQIDALVPVNGLDEWIAISRALSDTPSSDGTRVLSLSRDSVRVRLRHFGDAEGFRTALRHNGLQLNRGDEGWVLRRGGGEAVKAAGSGR